MHYHQYQLVSKNKMNPKLKCGYDNFICNIPNDHFDRVDNFLEVNNVSINLRGFPLQETSFA